MSYSPVAIVTGAARGIGLATTKRFLAAGWRVAMVDRDAPELALASEPLTGILPLPYDVSVPRQVDTMVAGHAGRMGPDRRADQQRGRGGFRADRGNRFRPLANGDGNQSRRRVPLFASSHARAEGHARRHRQHRVDLGSARLDAAGGLRHIQGGRHAPDPAAGGGTGRTRHPGETASVRDPCAPSSPWRCIPRRSSTPTMTRSR